MIEKILKIYAESMTLTGNEASESRHTCTFCTKSFTRPSTLFTHLCEGKRRHQQEKEVPVQLGLRAYLRFYELMNNSTKTRTYAEFSGSPYYLAFVRFGRYCQEIRCINFSSYLDWLLRNNKVLDKWTSDNMYAEWMLVYVQREAVQDAMERALKEMQEYADVNPELKNGFADYFRYGNSNRICHHIATGRISPWVIYNCDSGIGFMERLTEGQVALIMPYIDPNVWQRKLKDYADDTTWVKSVLMAAGL